MGIGDWAQSPIPNPQSPIPNPQSPFFYMSTIFKSKIKLNIRIKYFNSIKNVRKEGKGILYYNNGNRKMGDYCNDKPIGKHVILHVQGEVTTEVYK